MKPAHFALPACSLALLCGCSSTPPPAGDDQTQVPVTPPVSSSVTSVPFSSSLAKAATSEGAVTGGLHSSTAPSAKYPPNVLTLSKALGIPADQISKDLKGGKSMADITREATLKKAQSTSSK